MCQLQSIEMAQHSKEMKSKMQCPICGKTFAQQSTLKAHMLTHCEQCGKAFLLEWSLKIHIHTHAKGKLYTKDHLDT